jgi:hypothetical protein
VVPRNIIIVGSGATNLYALVLNDIFKPIHFIKSQGRALDQIVAGTGNDKKYFGRHALPPDNPGLIILSKSAFNPAKIIIWMAGVSGMGTQAVTTFFRDLLKGQVSIDDQAIGCVVAPRVPDQADIADYYGRWRLSDYELIYLVDRNGKRL